MIEVRLTPSEMLLAANAGVMRQIENLKSGKSRNTHGYDEKDPWGTHIEGCAGEMAVAKILNQYWKGKGERGERDVGADDVRTSAEHHFRLILHPNDDSNVIFWHVTGRDGVYKIHGWVYAEEGKNPKYWQDPKGNRPAYFVPNEVIRKPETHPNWQKL